MCLCGDPAKSWGFISPESALEALMKIQVGLLGKLVHP